MFKISPSLLHIRILFKNFRNFVSKNSRSPLSNQKPDLNISLLKTGKRDSIFHFLFSIWLFGILSMPDHINLKLWFHWKVTLPKLIDFICNRCEMNTIWNCAPFFKALPLWAGLEGSSFPATGAAQTVTQPLHLFWLEMIGFDWILIF